MADQDASSHSQARKSLKSAKSSQSASPGSQSALVSTKNELRLLKPSSVRTTKIVGEPIYSFEILRHYPGARSFIIKLPLKRSMVDNLMELFMGSGGNKQAQ